ncbi:MAG: CDP-6-deoxy-delta-3,4-glucoseen reductase [Gammaproteobacteria bacterium]
MSFTISVDQSDYSFTANEDETILEAALRAGVELPYGCRNGSCGSCKLTMVSGTVRYPFDLTPPALGPEESEAGEILTCSAYPTSDIVLAAGSVVDNEMPAPRIMPARVEHVEHANPDVIRLLLKLPDSVRMPFRAGQYINILQSDGSRRAFSIANAPHDDEFIELHIRYIPGGEFTGHVFADMKEKEILRIEGPLGNFVLQEHSGRPAILVGGGTGFAPLKSMIEHAIYIGLDKPLHLYWGGRTEVDLYMRQLAEQWARQHPNITFTPVVEDPLPEGGWEGRTGLVTHAVVEDHPDLRQFEVYASGPPAMVEAAARLYISHGLPAKHMYSDAFTFAHDGTAKKKWG